MRIYPYGLIGLAMLASAAHADPLKLSDAELDSVAAGLLDNFSVLSNFSVANNLNLANGNTTRVNTAVVMPIAFSNNTTTAIGLGLFGGQGGANAISSSFANNFAGVGQR